MPTDITVVDINRFKRACECDLNVLVNHGDISVIKNQSKNRFFPQIETRTMRWY